MSVFRSKFVWTGLIVLGAVLLASARHGNRRGSARGGVPHRDGSGNVDR
jgi:hypothetical protein